MTLEILLALLSNLSGVCAFLSVILGIIAIISIASMIFTDNEVKLIEDKPKPEDFDSNNLRKLRVYLNKARLIKNYSITLFILTLFIAIAPSPFDLWKIRISLIKLELSSPENVKSSVEEISRIGKKLECKYLGCETKEKSK